MKSNLTPTIILITMSGKFFSNSKCSIVSGKREASSQTQVYKSLIAEGSKHVVRYPCSSQLGST